MQSLHHVTDNQRSRHACPRIRNRAPDPRDLSQCQGEIQDLAGDNNHWAATVIDESFRGKNRVQQQRMVNAALKEILEGNNAPLHALALTTRAPD